MLMTLMNFEGRLDDYLKHVRGLKQEKLSIFFVWAVSLWGF